MMCRVCTQILIKKLACGRIHVIPEVEKPANEGEEECLKIMDIFVAAPAL